MTSPSPSGSFAKFVGEQQHAIVLHVAPTVPTTAGERLPVRIDDDEGKPLADLYLTPTVARNLIDELAERLA